MPSQKNPSTLLIRDYESILPLPLQGANGWGMYCIVKYKNAAPSLHLVNNQAQMMVVVTWYSHTQHILYM